MKCVSSTFSAGRRKPVSGVMAGAAELFPFSSSATSGTSLIQTTRQAPFTGPEDQPVDLDSFLRLSLIFLKYLAGRFLVSPVTQEEICKSHSHIFSHLKGYITLRI